ncbi:MAG: drug/metabolite transporter (DMT)-like permease [Bacteroidia bacterium]|jgi:drug/metabolite transporter (DMT)-like permease
MKVAGMTTNWKLGLAFSLITVLMWSLLPLSLNIVLQDMDPITISWYRFSVSALIALLWYGRSSGPALKGMFAAGHRPFTLIAVAGLITNYLLYIWGLNLTTPGASQLLIQLAPLILLIGSVVLFKEQFSAAQWLGVATGCAGMLVFFHARLDSSTPTSPSYVTGVGLLISAAVAWSFYGLAQKQLLKTFHTKHILLLLCLSGTVLLLPLARPLEVLQLGSLGLAMLGFASINTIVAYGCFGLAMSHWQASRVSAIIPLTPLLTLLFTELLNRWHIMEVPAEKIDWLSGTGALLVVLGAAMAALPRGTKTLPE